MSATETANAQLKSFIDRILRLKEEQDAIGDDVKDVYAEAKGQGFDKTALGNVVSHVRRIAKKGADAISEQDAIFALYLDAYEGRAHAPAPARENIEEFGSHKERKSA